MNYDGPERRSSTLTDEQIEHIAGIAARKALDQVYAEVGKGVLKKVAWVVGAATIGLLMWLGQNHITLK